MADINILVDSSQVRSAKQEIQDLGNSFNSASKSASIFMQAFERAARQSQRDEQYIRQTSTALRRLIDDNMKITNAYKSAEDSAAAFTEGLRKQEAQALKTARANQEAINKQLGVGGSSAISGGASFSAMEAEIDALATKYNKVYSASRLYEEQLNEVNRAHMLGVISSQQHQQALDQLNLEYQQYANAAEGAYLAGNRFSDHVNQTSRGLNNFGVVAQQVGYQVGDFFVQIQSGTNAFVAFGQQATQLAGLVPGLAGAILGIGISVTTAFLAYKSRTSDAIDETKRFEDALKSLQQQTQSAKDEMLALAMGFRTSQEGAILSEIISLQVEAANLRAQAQQEEGLAAKYLADQAVELERQIESRRKALEESRKTAAELEKMRESQGKVNTAAEIALDKYSKMRTVAAGVANELSRAADETFRMAQQQIAASGRVYSGRGGDPRVSNQQGYGQFTYTGPALDENNNIIPSGSGGGGGSFGAMITLQNKMEEVYRYLELDNYLKEQETIAYEQRQEVLRSALDQKLITLEEYNQLEKDLMAKHYYDLANIENQAQMSKLSTVLGAGEQVLQALGQHNEKAAKMARVFGAAQALADTYAGAAAALKLPFPGNLAAAASIISAGLGFVAAIKSGSSSAAKPSGIGATSRGSATVAPTAPAPTAQTVFIDSIDPDNLYSGQTLINLFEAFYDENDRRGKVFVVAR